jgi:hypothetical protein
MLLWLLWGRGVILRLRLRLLLLISSVLLLFLAVALVANEVDFWFGGWGWWGRGNVDASSELWLLEEDVNQGFGFWEGRQLNLLAGGKGVGRGFDEEDLVVLLGWRWGCLGSRTMLLRLLIRGDVDIHVLVYFCLLLFLRGAVLLLLGLRGAVLLLLGLRGAVLLLLGLRGVVLRLWLWCRSVVLRLWCRTRGPVLRCGRFCRRQCH